MLPSHPEVVGLGYWLVEVPVPEWRSVKEEAKQSAGVLSALGVVPQGQEARVESLLFEALGGLEGWVQPLTFGVPQERWVRVEPVVLEKLWGLWVLGSVAWEPRP